MPSIQSTTYIAHNKSVYFSEEEETEKNEFLRDIFYDNNKNFLYMVYERAWFIASFQYFISN